MKHSRLLVTALPLLLAAPALFAATATQQETFTGIYTPSVDGTKVPATANPAETSLYLVFGFTPPGGSFTPGAQLLAASVPLGPTTFTRTFNVPIGATNLRAGVLSLYAVQPSPTVSGVSATVSSSTTFLNLDFTSVFTGGYSENEVGLALTNGSIAQLSNFFAVNSTPFPVITQDGTPVTSTIVDFSNGTPGGTAVLSFTPVPEPGSLTLAAGAGLGLVGALARRRRRLQARS